MQELTYDFKEIVGIYRENGKYKFDFRSREADIYRILRKLGYCRTKLNGKVCLYKRTGNELSVSNFVAIKTAFRDYIVACNVATLLKGVTADDVLNAYYGKQPVKQNGLFEMYLDDRLSGEEEHQLRLQMSPSYSRDFNASVLLSKFSEWQLTESTDLAGTYFKGKPIFYKQVDKNNFLVFNTVVNDPTRHRHIFDCWISTYKAVKDISKVKPATLTLIKMGFKMETDLPLIKEFINS